MAPTSSCCGPVGDLFQKTPNIRGPITRHCADKRLRDGSETVASEPENGTPFLTGPCRRVFPQRTSSSGLRQAINLDRKQEEGVHPFSGVPKPFLPFGKHHTRDDQHKVRGGSGEFLAVAPLD